MPRAENFKRAPWVAAVSLVLLTAAGCAMSERESKPASIGGDQTRVLFERNCATCHGPHGEGKQLGTMNIPSLRAGAPVTDPDERLVQQVHDGGKGMPPFKYTLTDEQIQDLIRFVREEIQRQ
ncbi:MAG: quinohemoprotein ethanol dehydrogenase [Acidobacteriota bacterium]|jgi:mono/diheme cytochrome c family protein|nr:quinohemoprotein ethanol dehydrogenase [Acidobacteriota bacterium]